MQFGQVVNNALALAEINAPLANLDDESLERSLDQLLAEMNRYDSRQSLLIQLFDSRT